MVALLALRCAISCTLLPVLAWLPRVRDSFVQVVRFAAAAVALPSIGPFLARFESFACWFDLQRVSRHQQKHIHYVSAWAGTHGMCMLHCTCALFDTPAVQAAISATCVRHARHLPTCEPSIGAVRSVGKRNSAHR